MRKNISNDRQRPEVSLRQPRVLFLIRQTYPMILNQYLSAERWKCCISSLKRANYNCECCSEASAVTIVRWSASVGQRRWSTDVSTSWRRWRAQEAATVACRNDDRTQW